MRGAERSAQPSGLEGHLTNSRYLVEVSPSPGILFESIGVETSAGCEGESTPENPVIRLTNIPFPGPHVVATAPALDPAVAIDELIAAVEACVANLELRQTHGRALINKLESALKKLDNDDIAALVDKLNAFIDQLTDLAADGHIATDKANTLIAYAQAILDAVQDPGTTSPRSLRPAVQESTWGEMKARYR